MPTEFTRIATHLAPLAGPEALNLLDDAAIWTPPPNRQIILTTDQMLEGIHFLPQDPPDLIARKLLRRNLSDLAAMAATPLGYLLTTALPANLPESWLAGFAAGLDQDQAQYGIKLWGGDSSSSQTHISLTATLIGHVAPGMALRRNGARAGDLIFVTGTIGDAALGLRARKGELTDPTGYLTQRSLLPTPRINLPLAGIASAAIDISDGLIQDLTHLCTASNLSATINAPQIPTSRQAAAFGPQYLQSRLTDGDDYELLLAVPPENEIQLRAACGPVPVTKIGAFTNGSPNAEVNDHAGQPMLFAKRGWQHF